MKTTTNDNKRNVLITSNGVYNEEVHRKLSQIVHNVCSNKIKTNPTLSLEDLKQESWARIYEIIDKNLKKGIELEIGYLVRVIQTTSLGQCQNESKRLEYVDSFASTLLSSSDGRENQGHIDYLNTAKAKLEYEISKHSVDEEKQTILRLSLEDLLDKLNDELVRNLIIIRYIKEFNGTSQKIIKMYNDFYNSIDSEKQSILDNMNKFTNNAAFRVLGMRATDNSSTRIRKEIKHVLSILL